MSANGDTEASSASNLLAAHKDLLYVDNLTCICLELPPALFIVYLVVRAKTKYNASGMILWLMNILGIALGAWAVNSIFVFNFTKKLIQVD